MGKSFSFPMPQTIADTPAARVTLGKPVVRYSLRARGDLSALNDALGMALSTEIGSCMQSEGLEVLCLGPDEWLILANAKRAGKLAAGFAQAAENQPLSLVDISAREITFEISGPNASDLMTIGCPRNIEAFPIGSARRTVFDGASVILWRDAPDRFRLDVWNSFAPYVAQTLATGCKELAQEIA